MLFRQSGTSTGSRVWPLAAATGALPHLLPDWTLEERAVYVASIRRHPGLLSATLEAGSFLRTSPTGALRGDLRWRHPMESAFLDLASTCLNCLILSDEECDLAVRQLHALLTDEAHAELGNWFSVAPEGETEYYYHCESMATMRDHPNEVILPPFRCKLAALGKLIRPEYVSQLRLLDGTASLSASTKAAKARTPDIVSLSARQARTAAAIERLAMDSCSDAASDTGSHLGHSGTGTGTGSLKDQSQDRQSEVKSDQQESSQPLEHLPLQQQDDQQTDPPHHQEQQETHFESASASASNILAKASVLEQAPGTSVLAQTASRSTLGRDPGLPIKRWMNPEKYAQFLGLRLKEPFASDRYIFEVLTPVFNLELPLPWRVQHDGHRVFFVHTGAVPPITSWEHPMRTLHTELITLMRNSSDGAKVRKARLRPALQGFLRKLSAGSIGLEVFGDWSPVQTSPSPDDQGFLFEDKQSGKKRRDDPKLEAASKVALSIIAVRFARDNSFCDIFPMSEDSIWTTASQVALAVVQSALQTQVGSQGKDQQEEESTHVKEEVFTQLFVDGASVDLLCTGQEHEVGVERGQKVIEEASIGEPDTGQKHQSEEDFLQRENQENLQAGAVPEQTAAPAEGLKEQKQEHEASDGSKQVDAGDDVLQNAELGSGNVQEEQLEEDGSQAQNHQVLASELVQATRADSQQGQRQQEGASGRAAKQLAAADQAYEKEAVAAGEKQAERREGLVAEPQEKHEELGLKSQEQAAELPELPEPSSQLHLLSDTVSTKEQSSCVALQSAVLDAQSASLEASLRDRAQHGQRQRRLPGRAKGLAGGKEMRCMEASLRQEALLRAMQQEATALSLREELCRERERLCREMQIREEQDERRIRQERSEWSEWQAQQMLSLSNLQEAMHGKAVTSLQHQVSTEAVSAVSAASETQAAEDAKEGVPPSVSITMEQESKPTDAAAVEVFVASSASLLTQVPHEHEAHAAYKPQHRQPQNSPPSLNSLQVEHCHGVKVQPPCEQLQVGSNPDGFAATMEQPEPEFQDLPSGPAGRAEMVLGVKLAGPLPDPALGSSEATWHRPESETFRERPGEELAVELRRQWEASESMYQSMKEQLKALESIRAVEEVAPPSRSMPWHTSGLRGEAEQTDEEVEEVLAATTSLAQHSPEVQPRTSPTSPSQQLDTSSDEEAYSTPRGSDVEGSERARPMSASAQAASVAAAVAAVTKASRREFEAEVQEALSRQRAELLEASRLQVTEALSPVRAQVEEVQRRCAEDVAAAWATEQQARDELTAELARFRNTEVSEAMESLRLQVKKDDARERKLRDQKSREEKTAEVKLAKTEEQQRLAYEERRRLEKELAHQREVELRRCEGEMRLQLEIQAEHRELQWKAEHRELEFKAEMKQMRWQADWQAVRHLEESNLLSHPPGLVDGLEQGAESLQDPGNLPSLPRSRSRVAEALFGAIAASQDAQPRGDTGTGELFPRPSYKAIWNESATQVCQEPAPAKSRIDSQLAERVAADLEA
ncbi:unnamed protein product [Polarella glacialis]|uniref:Uncharacterized protein n=1 Tax=Polarella glacialis TaxID=89957 RepID=A0A813H091_POLGL|nr:unnamed protein product [Polarella glacialis]